MVDSILIMRCKEPEVLFLKEVWHNVNEEKTRYPIKKFCEA